MGVPNSADEFTLLSGWAEGIRPLVEVGSPSLPAGPCGQGLGRSQEAPLKTLASPWPVGGPTHFLAVTLFPQCHPPPEQEEVSCVVGFGDRKQALVGLSPGGGGGGGGNADTPCHRQAAACRAQRAPLRPCLTAAPRRHRGPQSPGSLGGRSETGVREAVTTSTPRPSRLLGPVVPFPPFFLPPAPTLPSLPTLPQAWL